jgi:sugar (pentulose or hexulose) kinase
VAVDLDGRIEAEVRAPYPTVVPRPGWAEQDPVAWREHAVRAMTGLSRRIRRPDRVLGIGLTGQCPTVAPFDRRGRPTSAGMLYRDNRALSEALEMRERIGVSEMHARTGHTAEAFHVGPKVLWLRRHEPEAFARTAVFLQPRDAVLRRLTGRTLTDETHANATLFFDLRARKWAPDLFDAFDLDPTLFPEALPPWETAGTLSRRVAEEVGLPRVPVAAGAADSQCVAFGAGVLDPGPVSEMAGASTCLNSAVLQPVDDTRVTHYSHAVAERFTTEIGLNSTGAAVDWAVATMAYAGYEAIGADVDRFRRRWKRGAGDPLEEAPLFLPYLADGERDDPAIRAAFVGLSSRHDRSALAYSVFEGVALGIRAKLRSLVESGCPLDELRVAGGPAANAPLGQLKADALGVPVLHLDGDAAAVGAALLGGRPAGVDAAEIIARVLGRARTFEPTPWGAALLAERAVWFDRVRPSDAVRAGRAP